MLQVQETIKYIFKQTMIHQTVNNIMHIHQLVRNQIRHEPSEQYNGNPEKRNCKRQINIKFVLGNI